MQLRINTEAARDIARSTINAQNARRDFTYPALTRPTAIHLAQDGARHAAGPRVPAALHTQEAWAYAAMGHTATFQRATVQTADALTDSRPAVEKGAE